MALQMFICSNSRFDDEKVIRRKEKKDPLTDAEKRLAKVRENIKKNLKVNRKTIVLAEQLKKSLIKKSKSKGVKSRLSIFLSSPNIPIRAIEVPLFEGKKLWMTFDSQAVSQKEGSAANFSLFLRLYSSLGLKIWHNKERDFFAFFINSTAFAQIHDHPLRKTDEKFIDEMPKNQAIAFQNRHHRSIHYGEKIIVFKKVA